MKIFFKQTGGIAGLTRTSMIDTDSLPGVKAKEIEDIIARTGFFALPSRLKPRGPGADRFVYTITVESGDRSHTVELVDGSIADDLDHLIRRLKSDL